MDTQEWSAACLSDGMQLLNVVLTGEQIHDFEPVFELFAGINLEGNKVERFFRRIKNYRHSIR